MLYKSNRSNASLLAEVLLYQIFSEALATPAYMVATPLVYIIVKCIQDRESHI